MFQENLLRSLSFGSLVAGRLALDFVLPPRCAACDRPIGSADGLCGGCWAETPFLDAPWCERLGLPFSHDLGPGALSPTAIAEPPVFDRARAATHYDGPARDMVLGLKFQRRRELALPMGRWMARAGREFFEGSPLVVPVPLHRFRLWQRRFNQSADLARAFARSAGLEVSVTALKRNRRTKAQVGLDAKERHKNVRGAFVLAGAEAQNISGRPVILIDDVLTTGSTVSACTRVLRRAGAARVDVLTFALADPARDHDMAI